MTRRSAVSGCVTAALVGTALVLSGPTAGAADDPLRVVEIDQRESPDVTVTVRVPAAAAPPRLSVAPRDPGVPLAVSRVDPAEYDIGIVLATTSRDELEAARAAVAGLLLGLPASTGVILGGARRGDPSAAAAALRDSEASDAAALADDLAQLRGLLAAGGGRRDVVVVVASELADPQVPRLVDALRGARVFVVALEGGVAAPLGQVVAAGGGAVRPVLPPDSGVQVGRRLVADITGTHALSFRLPDADADDVRITAEGPDGSTTAVAALAGRAVGTDMGSADGLSGTGSRGDLWALAALAAGLLLVGGWTLRRRSARPDTSSGTASSRPHTASDAMPVPRATSADLRAAASAAARARSVRRPPPPDVVIDLRESGPLERQLRESLRRWRQESPPSRAGDSAGSGAGHSAGGRPDRAPAQDGHGRPDDAGPSTERE